MKYRLIRFEGDKVILDATCVSPNQHGDNYEFRDTGNKAVLIQYQTNHFKTMKGEDSQVTAMTYYTFYAKSSEFPEALWQLRTLEEVCEEFKYIQMLQLTGAL
ncbi:MAG: hypothetical protein DI616_15815 [Paracoccus denitrificans]|uniref:Uncharacterized protein n=1 Tax=Paracoccus denitrificans TaxID=266 RepID=A0A533I2B6_PARDE|nr:MAG: hypothetical protein DI616_15815 [Paracoccus denitrificans]